MIVEVRKGPAFFCERFEITPLERWTRVVSQHGPVHVACWTKEPLGIQVRTSEGGRYALDLEGQRSQELLDL